MLVWQWKTVVALCRIVLSMLSYGTAGTKPSKNDLELLREAIQRDEKECK